MNPNPDPLAGLRDIHLPEAVSYWPPAPGWWLLLALAAALGVGLWLWRRARRRSLRRAALGELAALEAAFAAGSDAESLARGLSALLRRLALRGFGARRVAALRGADWNRFLAETSGSPAFTPELAESLDSALYRRPDAERCAEVPGWVAAVGGWIRENA
jgi:hypothetical protein